MKKFLMILLLLLSLVVVTSCGEEENPTVDNNELKQEEVSYFEVSIADAIMMANAVGEELSALDLCITGTIKSVSNAEYGNMVVTDGTDSINIYGLYDKNGVPYKDLADKPVKGDEITLYGKVHTFGETPEFKNAVIVSFKHIEASVDDSYQAMTIAEARTVAKGAKVVVSGVVAKITYANGFVPNGFYLVDNTGSIYVYGDDAQVVSEGSTVKIGATKDYYILETEQNSAATYGYEGSCQLRDVVLLEHTPGDAEWNKEWVTKSSVKEILDTPLTTNITTNIYKVTAYVNKVPGQGFINYYINDLDNETGSYVYTMCNGNDFLYLDEFDGKICTVYLSAINCKSSPGGCNYRFIPVLVIDENYTFDVKDAPSYAIKFHGADQLKSTYNTDPALELVTEVSNEALGFSGVTLEYSSNNTDSVYIEKTGSKAVLHTNNPGTATVTITAKYGSYTATKDVVITVGEAAVYDTITVAEAIATADGTEVTVEGIVMSSLVNKDGFYIWDETGVIAVTCPKAEVNELTPGNKVVIKGTRKVLVDTSKTDSFGQSVIDNSTVLVNYYGNHTISTTDFVTDLSLAEIYALDSKVDHTTTVYVVTGKVTITNMGYYSNVDIVGEDGKTKLGLYCSGAGQYAWTEQYNEEYVTIEVMLCNWNNKNYYRGTIVSITANGVKTYNPLNFGN